jgi:ubiquinone/menaquinone biosynthesis C-methylase UbiE
MTEGSPGGARDYVFDRTRANEERRLEKQAAIMDPFTDRIFRDGGLAEGMRVLDLGSGAGDVALLAARIVGPAGAVVGVEGSAVAIETARRRAAAAGLHHVTFVEGDLRELDRVFDPRIPSFDAVVGRFVLQFTPDPSAVLRAAAAAVRPGGLVCFQECDDHYTYAYPATPLWDQVRTWLLAALDHAGVESRMGLRLYQTFREAGLPEPHLRMEAAIGGGEKAPVFVWADVLRSVIPTLERAGIATEAEIDPDTLEARLKTDLTATGGIMISIVVVGAWSRTRPAPR